LQNHTRKEKPFASGGGKGGGLAPPCHHRNGFSCGAKSVALKKSRNLQDLLTTSALTFQTPFLF